MKVLVVGAGGQGAPCASILSRDAEVTEIRLADINMELLEKVKEKINSPKVSILKTDASSVKELTEAARGTDVVIDLLTPVFFTNVMKAAACARAHYINTAWEEYLFEGFEEQDVVLGAKLKLSDQFEKAGCTAILGCGMTSGYTTNVIARYYVDRMDTVESIKIRLAKKNTAIPDEEEILHPWNPGWNPRQAVLDFVVPTYKFEDGNFIRMEHVFAEPEIWEFPEPVGRQLVAHHAHEEPFHLPHTFANKGLKYCEFKYYVNKQIAPIVALGLGREEEMEVQGTKISPLDVVLQFVPQPGDAFLSEDPAKFAEQDRTQFVSIMQEIKGTKEGKNITYLIHVPTPNAPRQQMYDTYGTSMISVALPACIGAKMAVEGTLSGIIGPQDLDPQRFIELLRASGYPNRWEETIIEG